jgi:acyl-CoA synthetase (AMP-forming)/AMP-acid ligase II
MTAASLPPTIPHAAEAAARRWHDQPAILERGECWSFGRLWDECRRAASAFLAEQIGSGDRVAIWAPNCREWVVAAVGAMTAGAAIVPMNTRLKGREAGEILRRTGARMLVTAPGFLGTDYPALIAGEDLPALKTIVTIELFGRHPPVASAMNADRGFLGWEAFVESGSSIASSRVDDALAARTADDLSDIMFTSGTTGSPKGVMMTYGRVLPQCGVWIGNTGLSAGERYLIANPFFHSFGMKVGWVACLLSGAVMVPMPQFDVATAIRHIVDDRIAFLPGPPTIFQMLLDEKQKADFDCSSLRGGTTGAATVPPVLIERIRDELGIKDIITAYGMTECVNITSCRPGDPADLIANSCGAAIPGNEVVIAGDDGREVSRGETGEIRVRGQGVMLGYLDDPAATAEAIDADGWLHTGDVGTMDEDGYVRITDRLKDMFISGGFNVYPAEIEKLLSAHPGISMAAVIGIPDARMGEVGRAYVVLRPGAAADEQAMIAWSRENMANYKVPRSFVFVEDLPRNASGKVLKTELRSA